MKRCNAQGDGPAIRAHLPLVVAPKTGGAPRFSAIPAQAKTLTHKGESHIIAQKRTSNCSGEMLRGGLTVRRRLGPASAGSPELTVSVTEDRGPMQLHEPIAATPHQLPAAIPLRTPVALGDIIDV